MAAYVIGHITVKDAEKCAEYRGKISVSLARWGGEVILRGRRFAVLSGEHPHTDTVVIRFPDANAVTNCYGSQAYQALIPIREQAAERVFVAYET